jgi:hypothetical protein
VTPSALPRFGGAIAALLVVACASSAAAQSGPALREHRFTISGGLSWLGGYDIGTSTATLRRNQPGTATPGPFTLFRADASVQSRAAVEARLGYALTRDFALELGGSYGRPVVSANITDDAEAGPERLSDQRLSQYIFDASAVWQLSAPKLGNRGRPYVTGGAGYLRQLDVDRVKAETGRTFHIGAGLRYWLRGGDATRRALGLRAEARLQARTGGVDFAGKTRVFPVVNMFGFFGF